MKTPNRHTMHWIRGFVLLVVLMLVWQVIAADSLLR
jgi:hypothetical protein